MEDFDFLLEVRCANMLYELSRKIEMEIISKIPVRLQKSRKQKRVSPNDLPTQYVGRGKGWKADLLGNPFKVGEKVPQVYVELWEMVACNQIEYDSICLLTDNYSYFCQNDHTIPSIEKCVELYDEYLGLLSIFNKEKYSKIMELCRGKNLECWCKLGEPCHADILLKRCKEFFNE